MKSFTCVLTLIFFLFSGALKAQTPYISLMTTSGNGSVVLDWSVFNSSLTAQSIYRDTDSNPAGSVQIAAPASFERSFTDKSVTNGTTYYYWIKGTYATGTTTSLAVSASPKSCTPTAITPYTQVNGGAWVQTTEAHVALYGTVVFGPHPTRGGSWSWVGPNGYTSTSREIMIGKIGTSQGGKYIARYTNSNGCQSRIVFTISFYCGFTIQPYTRVNSGPWKNVASATVNTGGTVAFGPQSFDVYGERATGTWSWTGPNGFMSSSREITISNVQASKTGNYEVTFTDSRSCPTKMTFTITINDTQTFSETQEDNAFVEQKLAVYPNPVNDGEFTISTLIAAKSKITIRIFDRLGVEVYKKEISEQEPGNFNHKVNGLSISRGAYIVQVISNTGVEIKPVIIN